MKEHKKIYPFTILQLPRAEKFLRQQSLKGYRLISIKSFCFTFVESSPQEREYFLYKSPLFEKPDCFMKVFFSARRRYAIKKSKLNKSRCLCFEVDLKKTDVSYSILRTARSKHYLKYYSKMLVIDLIGVSVLVIASMFEKSIFPFAFLGILLITYSLSCICILRSRLKK